MDPKAQEKLVAELLAAGASEDEINGILDEQSGGAPESDSGWGSTIGAGVAAAGAGALAYAAKKYGVGKVFDTLNNIRRQSMLTGLAIPKSIAGNIGAGVTTAIEDLSLDPLKEMLRIPTNVKNAVQAFKQGATYQGQPSSAWAIPGRILGATDEASQAALMRAGKTADEAAEIMLQKPLGKNRITNALDTRLGDYLVPFRRTPINQGIGALETMSDWGTKGKAAANAAALGAGFVTGEETEGVGPTVAGTAAFGRRGLPFAAASMVGKLAKGDSKREAAKVLQGASPVSDYSLQEGVAGPVSGNPMPYPAILKLLGIVK